MVISFAVAASGNLSINFGQLLVAFCNLRRTMAFLPTKPPLKRSATVKLSFPPCGGGWAIAIYVAMIKLAVVPKMFKFRDWLSCRPSCVLNGIVTKNRIPEITRYIVENEDDYLFSSLTASYNCDPRVQVCQRNTRTSAFLKCHSRPRWSSTTVNTAALRSKRLYAPSRTSESTQFPSCCSRGRISTECSKCFLTLIARRGRPRSR